MTWTCSHCATRHDTPEREKRCRRDRRSANLLAASIFVSVIVVVGALAIAWAIYAYGDWTCAFAECRKMKP